MRAATGSSSSGVVAALLLASCSWWGGGCWLGANSEPDSAQTCNATSRSSHLWRIDGQPPSFLFGTVHVPYSAVWPSVSGTARQIFDAVQSVHFELDLTDPATLAELGACKLIEDRDTRLEHLLPEGLVTRIERYLQRTRIRLARSHPRLSPQLESRLANWRRTRPAWLMLTLASLTPFDLTHLATPPFDLFLTLRARLLHRRVEALEAAADQCRPLNSLSNEEAALALELTLDHLEAAAAGSNSDEAEAEAAAEDASGLIRSYRCGGPGELRRFLESGDGGGGGGAFLPDGGGGGRRLRGRRLARYRDLAARLRWSLVTQRNRRMARRVRAALEGERGAGGGGDGVSHLFAVGIGHLLDSQSSIVEHLRAEGYSVRLLGWDEAEPSMAELARRGLLAGPLQSGGGIAAIDSSGQSKLQAERLAMRTKAEREVWERAKMYGRQQWEKFKAGTGQPPAESEPRHSPGGHLINSASCGRPVGRKLLDLLALMLIVAVQLNNGDFHLH